MEFTNPDEEDKLNKILTEIVTEISSKTESIENIKLTNFLAAVKAITDESNEKEQINVNLFKLCLVNSRILFENISQIYFIQTNINPRNYFTCLDICYQCVKIMIFLENHDYSQHGEFKIYLFHFISKLLFYISHALSSDKNLIKMNMMFIIDILKITHRYFCKFITINEELDEIILQILIPCCKNIILAEAYKYLIKLSSIIFHSCESNKSRILLFLQAIYHSFDKDSLNYIQNKKQFKIVIQVYAILKVIQNLINSNLNQFQQSTEYFVKCHEMIESICQTFFLSIIFEHNPSNRSFQSSGFLRCFAECATSMSRFITYPIASLSIVVLFRITGNIIMQQDLPLSARLNFMEILSLILCFNEKLKDKLLIHPKLMFLEELISNPIYHQRDILCHLVILSFIVKDYSKKEEFLNLYNSYTMRLISKLSQLQSCDTDRQTSIVYSDLLAKISKQSFSFIQSLCPEVNSPHAKLAFRECISNIFSNNNFDGGHFFILSLANSNNTVIRSKALKCLLNIAEKSLLFVEKDEVFLLIKIRLHDRCASVRKLAIKIIAQTVSHSFYSREKYIDMILERIIDSNISVRKLVVKTLHALLISKQNLSNKPQILFSLSQRINDLTPIRKKIAHIFTDVWTIDENFTRNSIANVSDSVIFLCAQIGEQSYAVLNELLSLIKEELLESEYFGFFENMKKIADHLMNTFINSFTSSSKTMISEAVFVYTIAKIAPSHFHVYTPILISLLIAHVNNVDLEDYLFQYICKILSVILPNVSYLEKTLCSELEDSLIKVIVQRCSAISDATYCLKVFISHHTGNLKPASDLFSSYLAFIESDLKNQNDSLDYAVSRTHNICRILHTMSIFTKYFVVKELITIVNEKEDLNTFIRQISDTYLKYILCDDEQIKIKAILASTSLFNHYPKYFMDLHYKRYFIDALLNENEKEEIKHRILKSFLEFVLLQENVSDLNPNDSCELPASIYDKSSQSSTSMIIQSYMSCIQPCYLTTSQSIRHTIYLLIRISIKLGLLHPQTYVPLLITMTNDSYEEINQPAIILLKNIAKRYLGSIFNYIKPALELTFKLFSILFDNKMNSKNMKLNDHSYLFCELYEILNLQKYKHQFVQTLLKCLESTDDNEYALFITIIFAHLPFKNLEEILFLLYNIELNLGLIEIPSNYSQNIEVDPNLISYLTKYILLTKLKKFIIKAFSVNDEILDQYSPQSYVKDSTIAERNFKCYFDTSFFIKLKNKIESGKSEAINLITKRLNSQSTAQNVLSDATNKTCLL